jgi:hypothetical protein
MLEEESQLLRQCAEFTLATGLRENNVLNLEWEQVDLQRRVAWLHGDQTKAGRSPWGPAERRSLRSPREPVGALTRSTSSPIQIPGSLTKGKQSSLVRSFAQGEAERIPVARSAAYLGELGGDVRGQARGSAEDGRLGDGADGAEVCPPFQRAFGRSCGPVKPISLRYNSPKRGKKDTKIPTTGA